jgi:hypothetical protein
MVLGLFRVAPGAFLGTVLARRIKEEGDSMPPSDRWLDDRTHLYDYAPDSMAWAGDRDAFYVAQGFVYSKNGQSTVGVGVLVSGQDLRITTTPPEAWVQKGRELRDRLLEKHRPEADTLQESRWYIYDVHGRLITAGGVSISGH